MEPGGRLSTWFSLRKIHRPNCGCSWMFHCDAVAFGWQTAHCTDPWENSQVVYAYVAVSDPIAKLQFLGVGWGGAGMMTFLACAHMWDARQLMRCSCAHVRFYGTDGVGWDENVLWTCTHVRCYATDGVGLGGMITFFWTCTHVRCYATDGVGLGGMITFFKGLHTYSTLRNWLSRYVFFLPDCHWSLLFPSQPPCSPVFQG